MSRVKRIIDTGDSDSMEKARIYLESENLNETILTSFTTVGIPSIRFFHLRTR